MTEMAFRVKGVAAKSHQGESFLPKNKRNIVQGTATRKTMRTRNRDSDMTFRKKSRNSVLDHDDGRKEIPSSIASWWT